MKSAILLSLLMLSGLFGCQSVQKEDKAYDEIQEAALKLYVDSCWNQHSVTSIGNLVTDDFTRELNGITVAKGPLELEAYIKNYIRAFPDLKITIEDILQNNRQLICNWSFIGTNTGKFAEYLPTGKKAKVAGVSFFQFTEDGKILREETYYNELYLLQQLGYTLQPPNLE